ncbi:hypothetical protein AAVH_32138, partial [Aphelenchoides avenae]
MGFGSGSAWRIFALLPLSATFFREISAAEFPPPTAADIQAQCAEDREFCWAKAAQGECFGSSLKAQVLNKNCPCSCPAALHSRIQRCCKTVGRAEMKFCLPLCGYNTTVEE